MRVFILYFILYIKWYSANSVTSLKGIQQVTTVLGTQRALLYCLNLSFHIVAMASAQKETAYVYVILMHRND